VRVVQDGHRTLFTLISGDSTRTERLGFWSSVASFKTELSRRKKKALARHVQLTLDVNLD
jgi:hypothetical protein